MNYPLVVLQNSNLADICEPSDAICQMRHMSWEECGRSRGKKTRREISAWIIVISAKFINDKRGNRSEGAKITKHDLSSEYFSFPYVIMSMFHGLVSYMKTHLNINNATSGLFHISLSFKCTLVIFMTHLMVYPQWQLYLARMARTFFWGERERET